MANISTILQGHCGTVPYPLGVEIRQKLESPQGENKEGVQKLARAACTILECIGEESWPSWKTAPLTKS
jgi:hypothetical protein